jgi:O-antigen/teichoic acid export membrane protein
MANPVFQLAKRTWPLTLAALAALALDLALVSTPLFGADIEGLARAHALSLVFGFAVAVALAGRTSTIRPSWRDMAIVASASGLIALALHPLNALRPHILAAFLAMAIGGAILAAAILAFDVAGLREDLRRRLSSLNRGAVAPRRKSEGKRMAGALSPPSFQPKRESTRERAARAKSRSALPGE